VACWAHTRRKFFEARDTDARADQMLALIGELYAVETEARDLKVPPKLRRDLRLLKTVPILERIEAWLNARVLDALPKSPLGQALTYARNQWAALTRFVDDGILEADNNLGENALRPICLGRKNYLFVGSDAGGRRAAILYSLVRTCERHDVNAWEYLRFRSHARQHSSRQPDRRPATPPLEARPVTTALQTHGPAEACAWSDAYRSVVKYASTLVIGKRLESRLKTEDEPLELDAWDEALRES